MTLLHPEAWPLLLLVPLLGAGLWAVDRARRHELQRIVGARTAPPRRGRWLFLSAVLCAVLAVLEPAWGEGTRAVEQRGVDIVVCLDVSRSMLARDLEPDRLGQARREISALATRAEGDRLGLVVFAGEARLAVPLTRDRDSLGQLVELADPLSIPRGGTDLGAALAAALDALAGQSGDHEVILLLTDGDDRHGRGHRVAQECRKRGIVVHTVGLGTRLGAKIPDGKGYLRDRAGHEVVSALDRTALRRIAEAAGGTYTEGPLTELYEAEILPMARKTLQRRERRERKNRYQWPLLAAFLIWIVDLCDRRSR